MKIVADPVRYVGELILKEAIKFRKECEMENMTGEHVLDRFWVDGVQIDVHMYFEREKASP